MTQPLAILRINDLGWQCDVAGVVCLTLSCPGFVFMVADMDKWMLQDEQLISCLVGEVILTVTQESDFAFAKLDVMMIGEWAETGAQNSIQRRIGQRTKPQHSCEKPAVNCC
jgi:hypothetical protein